MVFYLSNIKYRLAEYSLVTTIKKKNVVDVDTFLKGNEWKSALTKI